MSIPSTPTIDALIERLFESGEYGSRTELIEQALRLLRRHELARRIQVGLDQLEAGEFTEYGEDDREKFVSDITNRRRG